MASNIEQGKKQGEWTRIRPLQDQNKEVDKYTSAGMAVGVITWGGFRTNLVKVMAYLPRLTQTEVVYANSFIFDAPTFRGPVQEAGFNDRRLKELVISRTSLLNRSRYSVTHHALLGRLEYTDEQWKNEGYEKYLHLHEHEQHPEVYSERERVVLDYASNLTRDAHLVTDAQFADLRRVLRAHALTAGDRSFGDDVSLARYVDAQIVELTWLVGHFCLLNRWFTALQVPDEGPDDQDDFGPLYEKYVPETIRRRNEAVLSGLPPQWPVAGTPPPAAATGGMPAGGTPSKSKIRQGKWTRVRPLQRDELDEYTRAGMATAETIWGIRNNLCKVMSYLPRLMQTEVEYANSFIFDPPILRGGVRESGFNDRFIKELVISRTSLINRSRYSITHHAFMGMALFAGAGRADEGYQKFLHLHEHERYAVVYEEREQVVLDYAAALARDAHSVTDKQFDRLRYVLRAHATATEPGLKSASADAIDRFVDAQIVELTWLTGHYCLLNRWFTALAIPDEDADDEDNFLAAYESTVPAEIRARNARVLGDLVPPALARDSNEAMMRRYTDAWLRGDVAAAEALYADDVTLHHFGRNPLAGIYRGKPALDGYLQRMIAAVDRAATLEVYDVFATERRAVTVIRVRFEKAGKTPLEGKRVTVFEIGDDGKIHDVWVRDEDQYAVDAFFS
jgi:alkylhydroperoxidase family enzyme/ketosteroid isomerase-like protein